MITTIRKKTKQNSIEDLTRHVNTFLDLLRSEGEDDSVAFLEGITEELKTAHEGAALQALLHKISEGFEGDLELIAYTFHHPKEGRLWGVADELYLASMAVLNVVARLKTESARS